MICFEMLLVAAEDAYQRMQRSTNLANGRGIPAIRNAKEMKESMRPFGCVGIRRLDISTGLLRGKKSGVDPLKSLWSL